MFDCAYHFPFDENPGLIDREVLESKLARMSDAELAALEDDLDFCSFAGVPSARVLDVLGDLVELDSEWQKLRANRQNLEVPAAF